MQLKLIHNSRDHELALARVTAVTEPEHMPNPFG